MQKIIRGLPWDLTITLLRPNIGKNLKQLLYWQWLDLSHTLVMQRQRLTHLLSHASAHVPYYRDVLREAEVFNTSGQIDLTDFSKIPLLDKNIIRNRMDDLKSDDLSHRRWAYVTSGGTTGEPVRIIQDQAVGDWSYATMHLDDFWSDCRVGEERCILLWGSERDLLVGKETLKTRGLRWVRNEVWLNSFRMGPKQMYAYVDKINALKPVQILGYVESLYELANFIECEGLHVYSPRAVKSTAAPLYSYMRETIERVFRCPVFNRYGSRESPAIASECEQHSGLHVHAPLHYLEVLRPDGNPAEPGEIGEIVLTSLTNYAMPLIRYRIGDLGMIAPEVCPCGRGWPLLKDIVGRMTDVFVTKTGDHIYGDYFTHLFYFQNWVKKFQVIQEDFDFIRVLIILNDPVDHPEVSFDGSIKSIVENMRAVMGADCRVQFIFVDEIKPSTSGKLQYTISKIGISVHSNELPSPDRPKPQKYFSA
jgi:phenylacetate-CoA ligase